MGSFHGVPHYGCLLNLEAEHRMKVNDPLYGQAELDAAVAAERERCVSRLMTAAAEYTASATENKFLTEEGRRMMLSAADWAECMAEALRALPRA